MQKSTVLVKSVLAADFAEMSLGISRHCKTAHFRVDLTFTCRTGLAYLLINRTARVRVKSRTDKTLLNYRCYDLPPPSCELDLQLWNKSSLQDQSYLKNMDTALPQHGREIKSLGLLSIDLRSYSVANPHIDSIILSSMHNMPTIPDICHERHENFLVNFFWPV